MLFGLISWCPDQDSNKCNNDKDCDEEEGFRCQILTDPEDGKERGECVKGAVS